MNMVSPASLRACAAWNDRAAKRSEKLGDKKSVTRQRANAVMLRTQAHNVGNV